MYLSKVFVQWPKSKSAYTLHKALWQLFPNRADDLRDFLFRVEQDQAGIGANILLQSQHEPEPGVGLVEIRAKRNYPLPLREEQHLRFLLKANPVKTIKDERGRKNAKDKIKKCRVPLIKEEEQQQWLLRRFDGIAELEELQVTPCQPLYFCKGQQAGKIVPIRFEGVIKVVDSMAVNGLVVNGIGPAKALGCGMLSLAPA